MIEIDIPGLRRVHIENVALDMNGTIAVDGVVAEDVAARVRRLAASVKVSLLTAGTFGGVEETAAVLGIEAVVVRPGDEARQKADFVHSLDHETCAAIGNGANDVMMLNAAALAIGVLGREGMASDVARVADVIVKCPVDALDLLLNPKRLVATLRR